MKLSLSFLFTMDPEHIPNIYKSFANDFKPRYLQFVRQAVSDRVQHLDPTQFWTDRAAVNKMLTEAARADLLKYGFAHLVQLQLTGVFPSACCIAGDRIISEPQRRPAMHLTLSNHIGRMRHLNRSAGEQTHHPQHKPCNRRRPDLALHLHTSLAHKHDKSRRHYPPSLRCLRM